MTEWALPLAALGIALVTFVATQLKSLQAADRDHVRDLSEQIREHRRELGECQQMKTTLDTEILQLRGENYRLFQRISELERKASYKAGLDAANGG